MSRASIASKRSRRRSKDGSTDGAHAQSTYFGEQSLPQMDTVRPIDDKEENCKPLVDKSSLEVSNSGPPEPPQPHVHKDTIKGSPGGALTAEANKVAAQEVQPTLSEMMNVVKQVLDILNDSTIASKTGKDNRSRFWVAYKKVAEEHDNEFLERYDSDLEVMLIFSGLFSAVSTAFIVAMESNLSPDPNDTTHALLTQLVLIGLGNFTAAGSTPAAPASTWSPSIASIRIQFIAYASLSFSLLAAFGAVLGKQWLGYYKSQRYGRGSEEERGKRRQEKFDGIVTWYFDAVVQSFPILLQSSLLLFGSSLGLNMWYEQHTIAWVIIATTAFGFLFYSLTVMAALVSPACPFQTPVSTVLRMLRVDKVLRPMVKLISRCLQKLATPVHGVLQLVLNSPLSRSLDVQYLLSKLADSVSAAWRRSFVWRCLQLLLSAFQRLPPWRCSSTSVIDSEAQVPSRNLDIVATNEYPPKLELSDIPTSSSELSSIKWLLETSTDPEIVSAAASLVPDVDWPLHLDVSDMLRQLYDVYTTCLDVQNRIIPSLKEKALACTKALCHLYCHRILQGHDDHDKFIHKKWADFYKFQEMLERTENDNVLVATIKLFVAKYAHWTRRHSPKFRACPDSVPLLDRLSRALPFHFITGKVDEDVEEFAITVISKLLQSPSSPSPQIIANCTLLACVMVGVQFNKKDIVRVDKSSALPQLANSLVQKVCILDRGINQAWKHLDVISRVLAFCLTGPAFLTAMWMLGMCRKIYSRADSTKQHDLDSVLRRFRFTIDAGRFLSLAARADPYADPANPAWLWQHQISWLSDSHLPEDFDWLVDYLGDVFPSDHDTAGDIFVLLSSMRVSYSPAKQHLFIEALTACMGSNMPPRLRHAALCAAHSSREVLASIDVNDADMVLTNLSPAILTAVCPQPGATPTDDSPDCFSHYERDLCYLELIFALARNSYYRPHLHCQMDRAIRMIALYCDSGSDHAFYLVGFFLRMTSEEVSATSLISITKQQWWDMMKKAWYWACRTIDDTRCVEFLPDLVDETKKYKGVASELDVKQLSRDVDYVTRHMESRGQKGVEELRSRTRGMLDELSRQ